MENQMPIKIRGVVAVTGASAGVGRAAARSFASDGYAVALIARGSEGLEAAKKEVEARGVPALALQIDVSDPDAVEAAAAHIEEGLGPIDVWVNNAMATVFAPFAEVTPEEFRRVTEVTYLGVVYGTRSALNRMVPRNRGTIVQVGSALAYRGIPLQSAYCGAKHGIKGFCESLRTELLHDGTNVWVTMVQLPALNTPQFNWSRSKMQRQAQPVPPIYQPEVAAKAIVWASHNRRREVLVGAPTVATVIANKLAPLLVMRYLAKTGFESQQTKEPSEPREGNLFEPVEGDFGAHGMFDSRATYRSLQLYLTTHRQALVGVGASIAAVALGSKIVR
jgi:short-subunit dehydrogenase